MIAYTESPVRPLFVDTGALFAFIVATDENHVRAKGIFDGAMATERELLTTNSVVLETYALLLNRVRAGRDRAIAFLDMLDNGDITVERVTASDEARATQLVRDYADKTFSLCDAQSFVVMQRLGLRQAVSFDGHFAEYGALELL